MAAVQFSRAKDLEKIVCICQDCVYYRIQVCASCSKGAPLCMYTLEEWFASNSLDRKCLDCTALTETLHVSFSLPYLVPTSQFIQQCLTCSKFKYLCSFMLFQHSNIEGRCHRAIRDGNERRGDKARSECIECKLFHDIREYKIFLKERYNFRVSLEPSVSCTARESGKREQFVEEGSYADIVKGERFKGGENGNTIGQIANENSKPSKGPVYVISTLKGDGPNLNLFLCIYLSLNLMTVIRTPVWGINVTSH